MRAFVVLCFVFIRVNGEYTQDEVETTEEMLRDAAVHSTSEGWENVAWTTERKCAEKGGCPSLGDVGLSVVQKSMAQNKIWRKDEETEEGVHIRLCHCDAVIAFQESTSSEKDDSAWGCRNEQCGRGAWCHTDDSGYGTCESSRPSGPRQKPLQRPPPPAPPPAPLPPPAPPQQTNSPTNSPVGGGDSCGNPPLCTK
mmetsp:Transcript_12534/g.24445  ORF Transcript_12534/g.24445 Transcript_12534/m.24445 type:complete len:197 (-) Transcript_12534:90-680(-)